MVAGLLLRVPRMHSSEQSPDHLATVHTRHWRVKVDLKQDFLSAGEGGPVDPNATLQTAEDLGYCGANFCVMTNHGNENLVRPPDSEIYEISGIYLCCVLVATGMVALFVDPLKSTGPRRKHYTARLALRSDEALGVRVSVARIASSLLDLGRDATYRTGLDSRRGRSRDFASAGFLIDLLPLPFHSLAASYSPMFILIGSQDLDVKIYPKMSSLTRRKLECDSGLSPIQQGKEFMQGSTCIAECKGIGQPWQQMGQLDSTVMYILDPQMFVHWLLPQRVASVTSHLAVWHSLLVSLQVCYWLRVVQGRKKLSPDMDTWPIAKGKLHVCHRTMEFSLRVNLFAKNRSPRKSMFFKGKKNRSVRRCDIPTASFVTDIVTRTNCIRLERASEEESSDTHKTLYDRVKRCREHKINIKAPERVNVDVMLDSLSRALQTVQFNIYAKELQDNQSLHLASQNGSFLQYSTCSMLYVFPGLQTMGNFILFARLYVIRTLSFYVCRFTFLQGVSGNVWPNLKSTIVQVAIQALDRLSEPRAANQRMGTSKSKEAPSTYILSGVESGHGAASDCKGWGNRRFPRKLADQQRARFPKAKIPGNDPAGNRTWFVQMGGKTPLVKTRNKKSCLEFNHLWPELKALAEPLARNCRLRASKRAVQADQWNFTESCTTGTKKSDLAKFAQRRAPVTSEKMPQFITLRTSRNMLFFTACQYKYDVKFCSGRLDQRLRKMATSRETNTPIVNKAFYGRPAQLRNDHLDEVLEQNAVLPSTSTIAIVGAIHISQPTMLVPHAVTAKAARVMKKTFVLRLKPVLNVAASTILQTRLDCTFSPPRWNKYKNLLFFGTHTACSRGFTVAYVAHASRDLARSQPPERSEGKRPITALSTQEEDVGFAENTRETSRITCGAVRNTLGKNFNAAVFCRDKVVRITHQMLAKCEAHGAMKAMFTRYEVNTEVLTICRTDLRQHTSAQDKFIVARTKKQSIWQEFQTQWLPSRIAGTKKNKLLLSDVSLALFLVAEFITRNPFRLSAPGDWLCRIRPAACFALIFFTLPSLSATRGISLRVIDPGNNQLPHFFVFSARGLTLTMSRVIFVAPSPKIILICANPSRRKVTSQYGTTKKKSKGLYQQPSEGDRMFSQCNVKAVQDKVSTFEINLRKKSLPLPAYIITGVLSGIYPVKYGEKQRKNDSSELSGIQLLSATAYQLKKPKQQLLIPITVWIGMEQAFIGADFTQRASRNQLTTCAACLFTSASTNHKRDEQKLQQIRVLGRKTLKTLATDS
ncbi:hypothetical protein PR048_022026 [Dryococelus australis]|uniref:Uncharacterized protein n=1 Tax=Dryococelus australis TaxID=614101 RepID=A0ABQ9GZX8_9NEOP|nr:hypothetical protein PR048_022026 [Dryococelus australis]